MPTLKGTEVSLFYAQCFLNCVSPSINVFIFILLAGLFLDRPGQLHARVLKQRFLRGIVGT